MKWFIEWESGRTEEISRYGNTVYRNSKTETWPKGWPKAIVSAVDITPPMPQQTVDDQLRGLANIAGAGFQQGPAYGQMGLGNAQAAALRGVGFIR
jgi:hypothetical protein